MLLQVLKSKIHRVTVTEANLDYIGSITIDSSLMEAAGIIPGERVFIVDNNNGEPVVLALYSHGHDFEVETLEFGHLADHGYLLKVLFSEICSGWVVSVFVNPTQFNNPEDLSTYPRTEEADLALLDAAGVDEICSGWTGHVEKAAHHLCHSVEVAWAHFTFHDLGHCSEIEYPGVGFGIHFSDRRSESGVDSGSKAPSRRSQAELMQILVTYR